MHIYIDNEKYSFVNEKDGYKAYRYVKKNGFRDFTIKEAVLDVNNELVSTNIKQFWSDLK